MALKVAKDSDNKLRLDAKNQYCWNTDTVMLSCLSFLIVEFSATNIQRQAAKMQKAELQRMMWNISHRKGFIKTTVMKTNNITMDTA